MSPANRLLSARRGMPIALVAGLALIGADGGFRTNASAQDPGTRTVTFKELDKGSKFTHIRNTKTRYRQANSQGDLLAFTNPLTGASGKHAGTLHVACTTTTGARSFLKSTITCLAVVVLGDGTLTVQTNASPGSARTTGAVTGGTGAYANARGVFVSNHTSSGADDTVALTG